MSDDRLRAPFTPEQVERLNRYQQLQFCHPFTCGKRDEHREAEDKLIATEAGWVCPAPGCDYTQNWCWNFMADEKFIAASEQITSGIELVRRAQAHLQEQESG